MNSLPFVRLLNNSSDRENIMEKLILVLHVMTALCIIGLILLQQGKGAEAGASFGSGASQTVFGSQGGGNFFTRATALFATVFFATSFGLAILAKNKIAVESDLGIPQVVEQASTEMESGSVAPTESALPVELDVPAVEADVSDSVHDSESTVSDVPASDETETEVP